MQVTPARQLGVCPLGTKGCGYSDCGPQPGYSCWGPDAPRHVDMADAVFFWEAIPERRSGFRLLLDRLGLRANGRHAARHPERMGLK